MSAAPTASSLAFSDLHRLEGAAAAQSHPGLTGHGRHCDRHVLESTRSAVCQACGRCCSLLAGRVASLLVLGGACKRQGSASGQGGADISRCGWQHCRRLFGVAQTPLGLAGVSAILG